MTEGPYFGDIVSSLEKVLYYERGRGSYFRATMVGTDFIDRKHIEGKTPEEVIENCVKVMREAHIIKEARYKKDKNGTLFTFEIEGCMHLPVEAKLIEQGVPAYICSPTNMILHKIREITDLAVEIADITVDQKNRKCTIRVVVFKQK
jgi:hypothetical protein